MVGDGASYIDAVTHWCAIHNLEPEVGAELVEKNPIVKLKIQMEAETLRLLRSES
jgi:hypothetical protein